jgi:hypothetical protein
MDIQHDVSLEYVLEQLSAHPGKTGVIPLPGLGWEIRMCGTETPGMYLVAVWSREPEPHQLTTAEELNALQFAARVNPMVQKDRRALQLQAALVVAEAEKILAS